MKVAHYCFLLLLLVPLGCFNANSNEESSKPITVKAVYEPTKDPFFERFIQNLHKKRNFNGNVLIAKKGKIIYQKSIGWANYLTKDSLQINEPFQLASISKTITAIAILQLVQKGKIKLSDTLQQFFPELPYKGISIRSLLTHRSGLTNYVYFTDTYWKEKKKGMSNLDAIHLMAQYKPALYAKPNTRFHYNNTNFMILGAIVEKVSKMPFKNYLQKNIFDKAGMKESHVYTTIDYPTIPVKVIGHDRGSFRYSVVPNFLDGTIGDKGVYSTVKDLFLFNEALKTDQLLSQKWLDSAYIGRSTPIHGHFNYGYGWRTFDDNNRKIVYHTGWWHGFKNIYVRDLKNDIVIVLLGNLSNGSLLNLDELYHHLNIPVIRQGAYDQLGKYHSNLSKEEEQ